MSPLSAPVQFRPKATGAGRPGAVHRGLPWRMADRRPWSYPLRPVLGAAKLAVGATVAAGAGVQRTVDRLVDRRRPRELVQGPGGYGVHVLRPAEDLAGAPVFAETGLGGVAADWVPVVDELDGRAAVWAADRPGLGWSEPRPDGDRGVTGFLERLELLREQAGVDTPSVLVGWSVGALSVMGVAALRPDLVSGLVLVDPSHPDEARRFDDPSLSQAGRVALLTAARMSSFGGAAFAGVPGRRYVLRSGSQLGRSLPPDTLTFASARAGRAIFEELANFSARCDEFAEVVAGHPLPDVPCVVLTAVERPASEAPDVWAELHREVVGWFPQGELREVAGSTHQMTVDRPDAVAEAVADVVERTAGA